MSETNKYYNEAKRWIGQAKEDLISAKILLDAKRYYLVCFLAQQIVEKALKSVIYFNKEDLVLGHSVRKLVVWASKFDKRFKDIINKISILDSYYIPTRYPNGLPEGIPADIFNLDAAERAFKLAESTVKIITDYLNF
ncbi:MAG: HEPN domain-containing protein [Candidatus Atribacteria bacterium]|nr:MAG: HEPN domain-containing protein [Candidatus Atribacteria bacterium]